MSPATNEIEERGLLISPKHILVATDLNDQEQLMPHIVAQARASGAFVTLVHAIEPGDCQVIKGCPGCARMETAKSEVRVALEKMAAALEAEGVSCAFVLKVGLAVDVVMDQIRISGATRLIMASHGRGKLGQFLFGSVANSLLGRTGIPIFIIGPQCEVATDPGNAKLILHPVSLHSDYKESAAFALELARRHGAALTLLHVYDSKESSTASNGVAWGERLLTELGWGKSVGDVPVSMAAAYGDVAEEIRRESMHRSPDLIVLGVKEGSATWPLPESTAYRILMDAACPVLVMRHRSADVRPMVAELSLLVLQ
jgi:nucleotide-binding universal stress UspA family protein